MDKVEIEKHKEAFKEELDKIKKPNNLKLLITVSAGQLILL